MWLFGCSFPSVLVMWFFLLPCPCRSAEEIKGCRADSGAVALRNAVSSLADYVSSPPNCFLQTCFVASLCVNPLEGRALRRGYE
jgi:hypothetical protein